MELFSLTGIIIFAIIILFFGRIISLALKLLFISALTFIIVMLLFGVSFWDIVDWVYKVVLWVV